MPIPAHALLAARAPSGFGPIPSIGWTYSWYVEGSEFQALGIADGGNVNVWPDETSTLDATAGTNKPIYRASVANLNNQPAIEFDNSPASHFTTGTTTSIAGAVSVVVIADIATNSGTHYLLDGTGSSNRCVFGWSGNNFQLFRGSTIQITSGSMFGTGARLLVGYAVNTASGEIEIDTTSRVTGATGNHAWNGLTFGTRWDLNATYYNQHKMAFVGLYNGDVRTDGNWGAFETWALAKYGI